MLPANTRIGIAVLPPTPDTLARAERLSRELNLPPIEYDRPEYAAQLVVTEKWLELRLVHSRTGPVYVDFVGGRMGRRRQSGGAARDPLVRAIGRKQAQPWSVIDTTAGLGRDAFVLALAGCEVTAVERSGAMAALLEDGLNRAVAEPGLCEIAGRIHLLHADARGVLAQLPEAQRPDAIYIDPMFPHRPKSAASKKEMQLLRLIAGDDPDAGELFDLARRTARHRVVVKRWLRAEPLGSSKPDIQYKGQSIRFDVYLQ